MFMTTNHVERLDAALVRPGRVDVSTEVGHAAPEQAARLYARFFDGGARDAASVAFGDRAVTASVDAAGRPPSMAELQGFLIARKRDAAKALADADAVAAHVRAGPVTRPGGERRGAFKMRCS